MIEDKRQKYKSWKFEAAFEPATLTQEFEQAPSKMTYPNFSRLLWVSLEGKKIKSMIPQELVYNVSDPRMPSFPKPRGVLSEEVIKKHVDNMVAYLSR